jgi:ribosomal-protein-alanine N-acetyltransferase
MTALPTIQTERLVLRPSSVEHAVDLHRLWTDKEVRKFLYTNERITLEEAIETIEEYVALAEQSGLGIWCIYRKDADTDLIGYCGLRYIDGTTDVELLSALLPTHWKQGFATEACRALTAYLFRTHPVDCVFAGSDPVNASGFGVTKRLGMHQVPDGTIPVPGATYYRLERSKFETSEDG